MKVVIDGNIGSGKTTQLKILEEMGYAVHREPIYDWPLDVFYSDPVRWNLMFQLRVLQTLPEIRYTVSTENVFYERSIWSALHVFWQNAKESHCVTYWEDVVFQGIYEKFRCEPDFYIYIARDPLKCYESVQKRRQSGDSKVTLEYIEKLDVLYTKMLDKLNVRYCVVNGNQSPEEVHKQIINALNSRANELYGVDDKWPKM
jgi:deoxyadenosine/deoxycytidine kinase